MIKKYSDYYYEVIEKYKLFHENGIKNISGSRTFLGFSLEKWIIEIKKIIELNNCETVIDFGCGKGFLYNKKLKIGKYEYSNLSEFWNLKQIYLYDPGVKEYSKYPDNKFDGVICTDVIEHIPENDVVNFIEDLFKLSNKFIFVVIATIPATKYFDDGNNIHLSLKNENDWDEIFSDFKNKYPKINQYIFYNN